MPRDELGEIRRSQLLQNGPGAIIDFRAGDKGGGPVSVLTAGLDHWENTAKVFIPINTDTNVVFEPRLQAKLKKQYFRQSPVILEDKKGDEGYRPPHIQGIRFPIWMICPGCDRLAEAKHFSDDVGDPSLWCEKCSNDLGSRVHVVPVRFVAACENGHIEDFPWRFYLQRTSGREICKNGRCKLYLKTDGASSALNSIFIICKNCKARASLGSIFSKTLFKTLGISCSGNRPWIGDKQDCSASLKTVQRGASNIYFPKVESALSIPPWDNPLEEQLAIGWSALREMSQKSRADTLAVLAQSMLMSAEELIEQVERRLEYTSNSATKDLRKEEYLNFIEATESPPSDDSTKEFRVRRQSVPSELKPFISTLVKVERLKEVKVQTGFSRITPPTPGYDPNDEKLLSYKSLDWLPASVVRGEGIFFALNEERLAEWKQHQDIEKRTDQILMAYRELLSNRGQKYEEQDLQITPEFILLHSIAHLFIRQLSLSSGYNTASIKERVYCGGDAPSMRGVLIFTGTSDSDGTLGGLARISESSLFKGMLTDALNEAVWCASDPICSDGIISTSESLNNAACHACVLLPETSCEHFNSFLDRSFVVGSPSDNKLGFFGEMLNELKS